MYFRMNILIDKHQKHSLTNENKALRALDSVKCTVLVKINIQDNTEILYTRSSVLT